MQSVVILPARHAATRLPGKPLADIHGRPMIVHVAERAQQANIGEVYVATDDTRIAEVAEAAGFQAIMTRADHASGSDRIYEAYQAIGTQAEYVVNVQGDLPTIDPDIIAASMLPLAHHNADIGTLAAVIDNAADTANPAVVKPVVAWHTGTTEGYQTGNALYFSRAAVPYGEGALYHHIGIYAYRADALKRFVSMPPSPLEKREKLEQLRALEYGMHIGVVAVETVPLGVDTPEQLEQARKLLKQQ